MCSVESFPIYVSRLFPDLTSQRPQLLEVAARMESFWDNGRTGDVLNISMPTRFGKSLLSTAFSSWLLVDVDERIRVLRASYAADLAETFSQQVRMQVEDEWSPVYNYKATEGTRSKWRFVGNTQDNHIGVGIGGGITGFGCDVAIVDDTAKNMVDAMSAAYTRTLEYFKESVLLGRLEGKRKIINVGTRWTVNDWFSMWPDAEEYVLPAMTPDGKSVCEAWKTTAELELERERVSDEVWNAQYMQRPTATGRIRLFEGWRPVVVSEVPEGSHVIVIDPATDYGKDWFVCGDYVRANGFVTLCDMYALQRATVEHVAAWMRGRNYSVAYIETNGAGFDITSRLRRLGVSNLVGFSTNADKYSRAYVQMDSVKNYFRIFAGADGDAVHELLTEADEFPAGAHDDLVDNVIMAFERLRI